MKKFRFRLQSVLDAREKFLEDCQLALAKVQAKLNQQLKELDEFHHRIDRTKVSLEKVISAGVTIDITEITSHKNYILKTEQDIQNQLKLIADTEVELEEKKKELTEAMKAKSILEKLKEKDFREFMANIERLDLIQIDEIATNRHKHSD